MAAKVQAPRPNRDDTVQLDDGRRIGIAEFGDPGGDPVLWFHGTPGARQQLPPDTHEAAKARGQRIVGVERPGTGRSTPYLYDTVVEFAYDVNEVVDKLGIDRFACVGLSGGGPYVLACAHQLPDRVVMGAVLGGVGPTRGHEAAPGYTNLLPFIEPVLTVLREPLADRLTRAFDFLGQYADPLYDLYARFGPRTDRPLLQRPEMKAMFIHDLLTAAQGGLRAPVYDLVLFGRPWGFQIRNIKVPIRFWQGDADLVVPPSHGPHQAALVADSSFTSVPGEGHFAGFSDVTDVLDSILQLWDRPRLTEGAPPATPAAAKTARARPAATGGRKKKAKRKGAPKKRPRKAPTAASRTAGKKPARAATKAGPAPDTDSPRKRDKKGKKDKAARGKGKKDKAGKQKGGKGKGKSKAGAKDKKGAKK